MDDNLLYLINRVQNTEKDIVEIEKYELLGLLKELKHYRDNNEKIIHEKQENTGPYDIQQHYEGNLPPLQSFLEKD